MNKDLSIMIENVKLNIRTGVIITYKNKILVEKNKNVDFAVIPGGRVKTLENTHECLIRELKEELGVNLEKEEFKMISFIENYFTFDEKTYHELYFVYKVELKEDYGFTDGIKNLDNEDSSYYFLTKEEFKKEKILPDILKEIIEANEFKNYVVNDIK